MQRPRPLILLLLLAIAAVDLAVVTRLSQPAEVPIRWPDPRAALLLAWICAQVSLVAVWVGLTPRPAPWPLAVVALIVPAWALLLSRPIAIVVPDRFSTARWLILLAAQAIIVTGTLWMSRGRELRHPAKPRPIESARRPIQFSIAQLLCWTVALAVLLGLGRWALRNGVLSWTNPGGSSLLEIAYVALGNFTAAGLALWAAMKVSRRRTKLLAACMTGMLAIVLYGLGDAAPHYRWGFTIFYSAQTALLLAALTVLRIDGYRLETRAESGASLKP